MYWNEPILIICRPFSSPFAWNALECSFFPHSLVVKRFVHSLFISFPRSSHSVPRYANIQFRLFAICDFFSPEFFHLLPFFIRSLINGSILCLNYVVLKCIIFLLWHLFRNDWIWWYLAVLFFGLPDSWIK